MNHYRVWMKDGYASSHDAIDEGDARSQAVEAAKRSPVGNSTATDAVRQDGAGVIAAAIMELVAEVRLLRMTGNVGVQDGTLESRALAMIFAGDSVADICRKLEISRPTLYSIDNARNLLKALRPSARWGRGPRRGHRATDGAIEAYDDGDDL